MALQKARYKRGKKKLGDAGLCKPPTEWRNHTETVWLADAPVHPLQQTRKDLERAHINLFTKRVAVFHCCATAEHKPRLSVLRPCIGG